MYRIGLMLREVQPAAVIVSTPHTLHYPLSRDAIASGAHVMIEKPMVTNSNHGKRLILFSIFRIRCE